MTDPTQAAADQIGQIPGTIMGNPASEQDIAQAAQATTGLGVTSVDIDALFKQIQALQARLDAADAAKLTDQGDLAGTVKTVNYFLAGHGDPKAVALGEDLAAAVAEAGKSGDTTQVAKIADRLDRHLARNAPYPGENYHYRNAVAFVSDLPDVIDSFKPAPAGSDVAVPAGRVVAGSVVG